MFYAYLVAALLALTPWNASAFLFVAAPLAVVAFIASTLVDAQFCFELAHAAAT